MKHITNQCGDIAVIGISGRFPQADNLEAFWENLASGKDSIRPLPESRKRELEDASGQSFEKEYIKCGFLDTVTRFEPGYFGVSEEEAKAIDPQHRLALELVEEAIQDAGCNPEKLSEENVGVFMATSKSVYGDFIGSAVTRFVNALESAIAGRIAYTFNFCGPTMAIDTACSSSLVALHYACLSLLNGECDAAVTGGVNIELVPYEKRFLENSPILSGNQCLRAFDKNADGTLGGEGGGILFLKKLEKALEDRDVIHAVITGSGVNSDGRRANGMSAPNQYAQAELINRVIEKSGVDPLTISYIETHGTGTVLGDPIEVEGITIALRKYTDKKQYIPIGSVKTNVGHLDTAAGIAGIMKVILALKNKKIPSSLHFQQPNPFIDFKNSPVYVNNTLIDWNPREARRAGVTSLGLIGTNVHAILEEAPVPKQPVIRKGRHIFTLSARTPDSLDMMKKNLKEHLKANGHLSPGDVAYTLNTGRRHLAYRWAAHTDNLEELVEKLETPNRESNRSGSVKGTFLPVFIYPDFDEDKHLTPAEAYNHPLFKEHYDQCIQMAGGNARRRFFAFQYASSKWMIACGLKPKAVFGIGSGKFAADVIQSKDKDKDLLNEAVRNAVEYENNNGNVDEKKLNEIFNKMLEKKYNLFLTFGTDCVIDKAVLPHKQKLLYFPLDPTNNSFYAALCELYMCGFNINWDGFYTHQEHRRTPLPPYAFDRKSYFISGDLSTTTTLTLTNQFLERERITRSQKIQTVTFDEILSIFQSSIPQKIDMECDFEENGGSSLRVMEIVEMIKRRYDTTIDIDLFFTVPTVKELIETILKKVTGKGETAVTLESADAEEERRVEASTEPAASVTTAGSERLLNPSTISSACEMPGKILMTGAAGFLGAHLLNDLMEKTDVDIYCLSREDTLENAKEKNRKVWNYYFHNRLGEQLDKRIFVVKGDITRPHLGMEPRQYQHLAETTDTVVHCAADVRHYGKYEHFEKTNVEGTRQVIHFCLCGKEKRLHHISTMAVSGMPRESLCFKESDLDVGQGFDGHVYGRSKFEAERLIEQAKSKGLKSSIFRVGNLVGRFDDGVFQKNIETNELYNQVKAITLLGKIPSPYLENREIEITPVDLCTKGMVNLMLLKDTANHTFHMAHPHYLPVKKLIDTIKKMGLPIEEVDYPAFSLHVKNKVESGTFIKEISRIFHRLNPENETGNDRPALEVTYDSNFTIQVLERTGFSWPELDSPYIEKMLRHCANVGYISI